MNDDVKSGKKPTKSLKAKQPSKTKTFNDFVTPEQAAATDDLKDEAVMPVSSDDVLVPKPKNNRLKSLLKLQWPPTRRQLIAELVIIILIVLGVILLLSGGNHKVVAKSQPVVKPVAAKPTTVPSTLSGLPVAPSVNKLPVTAVMIENSLDARPQSGLSQASVVFEAVAEGGITRFMALYQDTSPTNVGPIRSARPYYVSWSMGFDAGYAHVGGSPDAQADIKSWGVRDLDQFSNSNYYHRITTREAPHNVYTGIATLNSLEDIKDYTSSTFTGFPRKAAMPAKQPTATSINLTLSSSAYNVAYSYDAATNSYNRDEGGAPQMDANTNTQISPKVVIAMVVPESRGTLDATGAYYSDYNVIGSGPADVFQDGTETTGQWTKSSNTSQVTFTDSTGKAIALDPGQTWISAITSSSDIVY